MISRDKIPLQPLFKEIDKDELVPLFKEINNSTTNHLLKYPGEEFKNINFENNLKYRYEDRNYGRVYSKDRNKFLSLQTNTSGYDVVNIYGIENDKIKLKRRFVHRLVANEFCDNNDSERIYVNHIDSDRSNNHYTNLEWCTHQENMDHMKLQGYIKRGEDNHNSIFTNEEVHTICKMLEDGFNYRQISEYLGREFTESISSQIGSIRRKITWVHISNLYNIPPIFEHNIRDDGIIHKICIMMEQGINDKDIVVELYNVEPDDKKTLSKYYKFLYKLKSRERYKRIVDQYNIPYPKKRKK